MAKLGRGGGHEDGAYMDDRVALLGVVEVSKEVASLVWRERDVPMRKIKLTVKLIGHICHTPGSCDPEQEAG
jgi:hypothetical protein